MKRKNGFFSMSIIYSFFIVFVMISAVLLSNYAHNRALIRDYNKDIKENLDNEGNNKLANLKNLLNNGSFETNTSWTFSGSAAYDTSQQYNGIRSVLFYGEDSDNKMTQILSGVTIKRNHVYYVQLRMFTTAGEEVTFTKSRIYLKSGTDEIEFNNGSIYSALENPNPTLTPPVSYQCVRYKNCYRSANWEYKIGVVNSTPVLRDIQDPQFIIEQEGTKEADIYIDCVMLIDLTDAYGDAINRVVLSNNNVPWLNANIQYFEKKYIHNKSDIN